MKHVRFFILLLIVLPALAEDQNWTENDLTFKLKNNQSIRIASEIKYRSWDWSDGVFVKNWVVGYDRKLSDNISLGIHYKQELTRKADQDDLLERRVELDAGWGRSLKHQAKFDIRTRLEIRYFDDGNAPDHYQLRIRFRLSDKWSAGRLRLEPFIYMEPFYDTVSSTFSRYRFSVGSMVPLGSHARLRLAYLRQDKRTSGPEHVFNTGVSVVF